LKDASNKILSLAEMQRKYSLDICSLKYYGLVSALLWNTCKNRCINDCDCVNFVVKLIKCQSANQLVCTKLISTKCTHPTRN